MLKNKRRGRPAGSKNKPGRKPGRPAKRGPKKKAASIPIPVESDNMAYWSELVVFLNENKGKNMIVQTDGKNYSLNAM